MNHETHPMHDWLSKIRQDFHKHPELSNQEFRTTGKIKEILCQLGVKIQEFADLETGVVGLITCQPGEKTLALRADIDALPMTQLNDVPYKSVNEGVMHSCGHDCHTAIMLGVAKKIMESDLTEQLKGNIKFLFQPAEEKINGAKLMIDAGVLKNPDVDRIIGGHMSPDIRTGQIGFHKKVASASADSFHVTIQGKGAHGAYPHNGLDPIVAGAHFVTAVQSIISRNLDPLESAVITLGQFQAGTAPNIIPDTAMLSGTLRTFDTKIRDMILHRLREIAQGIEKGFQVKINLQCTDGVPPTICHGSVTSAVFDAAGKILGKENLKYYEPQMGAEDYGLFTQVVPGTFLRLGCGNPDKEIIQVHSPHFDVDETALPIAVEVFTEAVRSYLS
jgi:amidohydrolase